MAQGVKHQHTTSHCFLLTPYPELLLGISATTPQIGYRFLKYFASTLNIIFIFCYALIITAFITMSPLTSFISTKQFCSIYFSLRVFCSSVRMKNTCFLHNSPQLVSAKYILSSVRSGKNYIEGTLESYALGNSILKVCLKTEIKIQQRSCNLHYCFT